MQLPLRSVLALLALGSAAAAIPALEVRQVEAGIPAPPGSPPSKGALDQTRDPIPADDRGKFFNQGTPVPITSGVRRRLKLVANLAASMYCPSVQAKSWTCGPPCAALPGTKVLYGAGDGDLNPHQNVVWIPEEQAIGVLTEGSNLSKLFSILNDIVFVPLPPTSSIRKAFGTYSDKAQLADVNNLFTTIHGAFLATQDRAYPPLLAAVKKALVTYPQAKKIIVTGHSLGAAIALLNTLSLRHDLGTSLAFEHYGYGSPRVFNAAGASLVDALASNPDAKFTYRHIHSGNDPVPHLGPLLFGFQHAKREVFLPSNTTQTALACPGIENVECSLGRTKLDFDDHKGPYFGRLMGRKESGQCTA